MPFTKNQQTSHHLGGIHSDITIARLIAAGYTNAQLALALGTTVEEVARILALPTPT